MDIFIATLAIAGIVCMAAACYWIFRLCDHAKRYERENDLYEQDGK